GVQVRVEHRRTITSRLAASRCVKGTLAGKRRVDRPTGNEHERLLLHRSVGRRPVTVCALFAVSLLAAGPDAAAPPLLPADTTPVEPPLVEVQPAEPVVARA